MRRLTALALLTFLLFSRPAFATIFNNQEDDSEHQTSQYGQFFGIVLGSAAALTVLLVGYAVFKGIRAEHTRGKKKSPFREDILDKMPRKKGPVPVLGEKVPEWKIDNRQKATRAALKFLACTDNAFSRKRMIATVESAFYQIKSAQQARKLRPIVALVTHDCLEKLIADIKKLQKDGKFRVFGKVEVIDVEVIHLETPVGKKNHTFTALISARSKDYFEDDKSGRLLSGDKKTYLYQEFWQFHRSKDRWLVARMRPTADMDRILEAKNVMAQIDLEEFAKNTEEEYLREFVAEQPAVE